LLRSKLKQRVDVLEVFLVLYMFTPHGIISIILVHMKEMKILLSTVGYARTNDPTTNERYNEVFINKIGMLQRTIFVFLLWKVRV
jgi:hypothetical protein